MTGGEQETGPRAMTAAVVTASYTPDFERCRLLCETMDSHVTSFGHHYLLVEGRDVALFRQLQGPHRTVVDERDILPGWLRAFDDPASLFKRRIWLSLRTKPLRGWHVQQLRRMAIAFHAAEDVLVYCDSDVVFLKPFDCSVYWRDGRVRLFRRDNALLAGTRYDHREWSRNAGRLLGIPQGVVSNHDYITTLMSWRRKSVLDLCGRIENLSGRHWVATVGSDRKFSECMIYGRYIDEVVAGADHFHGSEEYCRVHWFGEQLSDAQFHAFIDTMTPEQVAIGIQSFTGMDISRMRRLIGLTASG